MNKLALAGRDGCAIRPLRRDRLGGLGGLVHGYAQVAGCDRVFGTYAGAGCRSAHRGVVATAMSMISGRPGGGAAPSCALGGVAASSEPTNGVSLAHDRRLHPSGVMCGAAFVVDGPGVVESVRRKAVVER